MQLFSAQGHPSMSSVMGPGEPNYYASGAQPSMFVLQLFSARGHPSMSSSLDSKSPYWRLVRKGTAPAFNPNNLR